MKLQTLQLTGPDVSTFLQGQSTCDIHQLDDHPILAAFCNQKGRMIANYWIWRDGDVFYLQLPESMTTKALEHLKKYLFRSQVTFETIQKKPHHNNDMTPIWILPETTEQCTPQMIDLQKHGGVSFTKGCYLGQEIIARTEHLGQLKRHLYQITLNEKSALKVGDPIQNPQEQKMGTIVAINDHIIFAVIEDRAIHESLAVNQNSIATIARA